MTNGVGYIRTGEGIEKEFGVIQQKAIIQRYAQVNDIVINDWYIDDDEIRGEFNRLIFSEAGNNKILSTIVVANSKVVTEDIYEWYFYKYELNRFGVKIESVVEQFGELSVFSGLLDRFIVRLNELQNKNVGRLRVDARLRKTKLGLYCGKAPYGYDKIGNMLLINKTEAEAVKDIFHMKEIGFTYRQIVDALNRSNIPAKEGGFWGVSSVQSILRNRMVYQGFYRFRGNKWVQGTHERILDYKEVSLCTHHD